MATLRTVKQARLAGILGAQRALKFFGLEDSMWIDVFDAIPRAEALLIFRPLENLYGAYLPRQVTGGELPGVLIHSGHPLKVQRFTAAHELGHLWMQHEQSLDTEAEIFGRARRGRRLPLIEVAAETFASHFLMPARVVAARMHHLGIRPEDLRDTQAVYSLSLWLGASYEATAFHLASLKYITPGEAERLADTRPKAIKTERLSGARPEDPWADVWNLSLDVNGNVVHAREGDEFVVRLPSHAAAGYLWNTAGLDSDVFEVVSDRVESDTKEPPLLGGSLPRLLLLRLRRPGRHKLALTEQRPWSPSVRGAEFHVEIIGVEKVEGLISQQRPRAA